ncbi:MAG: hypothetical protein CVU87_02685 [Firmicutes bacterium HGW-Firmicutes-12]|jgi:hypothetical protein|nr:MAG: hypothetical protein CVU87_02685 [Firmicutes bacterium HGW-Firmicutes-12]
MDLLYNIEGLIVGCIGRPILTIIKWLRWVFLLAGIYFNSISTIDMVTKEATSKFTIIPFIIGLILFSIGLTIKRYDVIQKEYTILCKKSGTF